MLSVFSKPITPITWVIPGLLLLWLVPGWATPTPESRDLGVMGKVYPVQERSLLDVLMDRLQQAQQTGELGKVEKDARQRWQAYAHEPPGNHYPRAPNTRTRTLDMTLTLENDLSDADGIVFAEAGTKVNPLAMMQLSKDIVLFDGTDAAQSAWAKQYIASSQRPVKPILTAGKVLQLMQDWKTPLWFDQGGYLAKRFRIEYLPVVLRQQGQVLALEEVVVHD